MASRYSKPEANAAAPSIARLGWDLAKT